MIFVGTPSLDIHVESFSGIECLWALALKPLHPTGQLKLFELLRAILIFGAIPVPHPLGQLKLFESLQAILMVSAKEGKRAAEGAIVSGA